MMDIRNGIMYDTDNCFAHGQRAVGLSPIEGQEEAFAALVSECTCTVVEVLVRKVSTVRRLRASSRYHQRPFASRGVVVIDQAGLSRHFARFPVMYYGDVIPDELWEQGSPCIPTLV